MIMRLGVYGPVCQTSRTNSKVEEGNEKFSGDLCFKYQDFEECFSLVFPTILRLHATCLPTKFSIHKNTNWPKNRHQSLILM